MANFTLKRGFKKFLAVALMAAMLVSLLPGQPRQALAADVPPGNNGLMGVNLGDGLPFVDAAKTLRPWGSIDGEGNAPVDGKGYPTTDAYTVLFDYRPVPAWDPPIDDPEAFQLDMSGVYKLSFQGQADLTVREGDFTVENKSYDEGTNITKADVVVATGAALVVLGFTNTKRQPSGELGTGFADLKIIRPGYAEDTAQVFTDEFLQSLEPFSTLRFMDWLATNDNNPNFWDPASVTQWSDRRLPDDATQLTDEENNKYGYAWEYIIELANETRKDIWINIPSEADDAYVSQLAQLLEDELDPGIKVYVEYSNEVWNSSFKQYTYNQTSAEAEVAAGGSTLNNDGSTDRYEWGRRRFVRRSIEISRIFAGVFGQDSINDRIRVVYTWQPGQTSNSENVLQWADSVFAGVPSDYLYAYSIAPYYNYNPSASGNASVEDILSALSAGSAQNLTNVQNARSLSDRWDLELIAYEGGPSTGNIGSTQDVQNIIRAHRDSRIKDIMLNDLKDVWFASGGGLYMHFNQVGYYSRYGCWGLTEDVRNTCTPKYQAIREAASLDIPEYTPVTPGGPADGVLTGTLFGSEPDNTTIGYAFDGDTDTYYAGAKSSAVGIDLGAGNEERIVKIRFFARGTESEPWLTDRAAGTYEGSVDGEAYTPLVEVGTSDIQFGWNEVEVSDTNSYRYLRFVATPWHTPEMAEIEFYGQEDSGGPQDPGDPQGPYPEDHAMYNFENGLQDFTTEAAGASVAVDDSIAYAGERSLKYTVTQPGQNIVHVIPAGGIPLAAGTAVEFRVYVGEGYEGLVQPFVHNGSGWDMAGGWPWFGGTGGLPYNTWTELTVTYTGTDPSPELGVKLQPEAGGAGSVWIDSITYDGYVPPVDTDTATYNFENNDMQGFSLYYADGRPHDDSLVIDSDKAYAGNSSLRLDYADYAYVNNQPGEGIAVPAGSQISFHVFVPEGFTGVIHPFILDGSWKWTGAPTDASQLTTDAWNEIILNFPSTGVSPLKSMVIEVTSSGTGSIWLDSINVIPPDENNPVTPTEAAVTINKSTQYQRIEGFGAFGGSIPSWGNQTNLYTEDFLNLIIGDLGTSIIRTEVAGSFEKYNDNDDPNNTDLSKYNIDTWYGEEQEQAPLRPWLDYVTAAKTKADSLDQPLKVITSIWSPPYWMKYVDTYFGTDTTWNRLSNGVGPIPGVSGEKANMYPEYAEYLYAYTQIFKQETGFDLYGLSLQNEPAFGQSYPSAVYSAEQYRDMLKELGARLKSEGVDVKLFGAEDVQVQERIQSYLETTASDEEARNYLDIMAVHGYSGDGVTSGDTDEAWINTRNMAAAYDYPLWMTETSGYSNDYTGALKLANSIHSALYHAHVNAWVWWMYTGGNDDTFTLINNDGTPSKKYYTSKNYYRYVRPGSVMVQAESDNAAVKATAFNDGDNGTFTVVLINNAAEAKEVSLSLTGTNLPGSFDVYLTSETENCTSQASVNADDTIQLPAKSVMTLTGSLPGADTGIAPVILSQPASVSVTEGQIAQFAAEASGTPDLAFQWYKDDQPMEGETGRSYRMKTAATLADNGTEFTVRISNAYGEVTSQTAVLSVSGFEGLQIRYTDDAPVIDGAVDSLWDDIPSYAFNKKVIGNPEPDNFSGNGKVIWDEDCLYLLYDITDDVVLADKDDVELFFDNDNSKSSTYGENDYQFVFKYGNPVASETKHSSLQGVEFTTVPRDGGFYVEARIPWTALALSPAEGMLVGLDLAADDTDVSERDSKIAWNTTDNNIWQTPSFMGTGKLTGTASYPVDPPTVSTGAVTGITSSSATVSGSVTADGGAAVTARGFVYGTSANPAIGGAGVTQVESGSGTGAFSATLTGLSANTSYHVRAYSTNSEGTSYGADAAFTTPTATSPYTPQPPASTPAPTAVPTPVPTVTPMPTATPTPVPPAKLLKQVTVPDKKVLYIGGTTSMTYTIKPELPAEIAKEATLSYATSNKKIAKVNQSGKVTAVGYGPAKITTTVQLPDGSSKTFTTVIIVKKACFGFGMKKDTAKVGDSIAFEAYVRGYREEDIYWTTNKKDAAVVGKNKGKLKVTVKAKTAGADTVILHVLGADGKYRKAEAKIVIKK